MELWSVGRCELTREEGGVTSLRVSPNDDVRAGVRLRELACGTDGVERAHRLRGPDEVRMRAARAQTLVVGRGDDVPGIEQLAAALHEQRVHRRRGERRRATALDTDGAVRVGNHRAPPVGAGRSGTRARPPAAVGAPS